MNQRQKNATLVFRITGVILAFLGVIFMSMRSFPYPVSNISNVGALLFGVFITFLHLQCFLQGNHQLQLCLVERMLHVWMDT